MKPIKRALISVSDKTGIGAFASFLNEQGIEILSTGGTASLLIEHKIAVTEVSDYTGFPEIMDGRVKTLHPKIYGGILSRAGTDDNTLDEMGFGPIDLVVVNLYPFEETIKKPDCDFDTAIENIDIGGPTMIRATAKNCARTSIVVNHEDYANVIKEMRENNNCLSQATRFLLATKAFEHTAAYDDNIASYFGASPQGDMHKFPATFNQQYLKTEDLRYGENPHQDAAFYAEKKQNTAVIANSRQLQGKAMSFNNIVDADSALECVKQFSDQFACVIVKHANPCGVAIGSDVLEAYEKAYETDPTSAFGGIIAFNCEINQRTAEKIVSQQFVEVIIAPVISENALEVFSTKKNIRVLKCNHWQQTKNKAVDIKRVGGGILVQDSDQKELADSDLSCVTERQPQDEQKKDLLFAWKVAKFVKSNAIVYVKNQQTIGIGAGQMSRLYSAIIAGIKAKDAGLEVKGSVMASDAFFPFRDGLDRAAEAGISAVIQPGGSLRDDEVIDAANEHNMTMLFTGIRHFRH